MHINKLSNVHYNYEYFLKNSLLILFMYIFIGTYVCGVRDSFNRVVSKELNLLVLDKPLINLDFVKAIDSNRIYLNWTVSI